MEYKQTSKSTWRLDSCETTSLSSSLSWLSQKPMLRARSGFTTASAALRRRGFVTDRFGSRRKRFRDQKIFGATEARVELRGTVKMRDFLTDFTRDLRQIRLPFSVNQVGVYYEVLLAGTEKLRQRRELVQVVEEHSRGPFGGPIRKGLSWLEVEKYKNFRGFGPEPDRDMMPLSSKTLLRADSKTLSRCPTPPAASNLFIGFLEDDASHWPGLMEHLDTRGLSHWSLMSCLNDTSASDEDELEQSDTLSTDSVAALLPSKPQNTNHLCILDHPGQSDQGRLVANQFRWRTEQLRLDSYTPMMARFAMMLHKELRDANAKHDVRRRIRCRRRLPRPGFFNENVKTLTALSPKLRKPRFFPNQMLSAPTAPRYPQLPQIPFKLSNAACEPLTSFAEEQHLFKHCWSPRGIAPYDAMALDLPLQSAWDIGRRGCFTKVTVMSKRAGRYPDYPRSFLRYVIMDGTEDDAFLTYYSWSDNLFRHQEIPKKIGTISVVDVKNGIWDLRLRELRLHRSTGVSVQSAVIIHNMTLPFFSALMTCARHHEAIMQLRRIRRRRYFLRRYDCEIAYLTALRDMLLHTKALLWQDRYVKERSGRSQKPHWLPNVDTYTYCETPNT